MTQLSLCLHIYIPYSLTIEVNDIHVTIHDDMEEKG